MQPCMHVGLPAWMAAKIVPTDGSKPQHAGQASNSNGGKNKNHLNRPRLDANELCSLFDPQTGMACINKLSSQVIKGKRYYKCYCSARPLGSVKKRCHNFRRKPGEPWP
eukprot:COSAG05_NODE_203_length_14207_cov_24.645379_10_plen_109_part_00